MKIGRLIIERKTDAEHRAERQELINKMRQSALTKAAAERAQAKLDAEAGR